MRKNVEKQRTMKNFETHELVPPEIHHSDMPDDWFISDWQRYAAELFRSEFGPTIINDYGFGGNVYADGITYELSGTRPPRMDIIGADYSQHKLAMALDLKFFNATPEEVREWIRKNEKVLVEQHGITTYESGDIADTWVHIDGRRTNSKKFLVVG